jgi:hypothetical protein
LDKRWGIEGSMSRQAQRMVALAGSSWSFDRASKHLEELCGWSVSDKKIREVCHEQASLMAQWQRDNPQAHQAFREARGDAEFCTDGTMVSTTEGWREMRLGIFSKRPRGAPATPQEWNTRRVMETTARVGFAAIETSTRFGLRWERWTERLGIRDTSKLSVLADGARWIWEESALHFAGASEVLDIFHAVEQIAATAQKIYGEGTDAARAWTNQTREKLIAEGWPGVEAHLRETKKLVRKRLGRVALKKLETYLGRQPEHLQYAKRLAEGRTIGSGQAEGACRHMIGRRLKNGGRWKVRRVNRMANLCATLYSDHWDTYWKSA